MTSHLKIGLPAVWIRISPLCTPSKLNTQDHEGERILETTTLTATILQLMIILTVPGQGMQSSKLTGFTSVEKYQGQQFISSISADQLHVLRYGYLTKFLGQSRKKTEKQINNT